METRPKASSASNRICLNMSCTHWNTTHTMSIKQHMQSTTILTTARPRLVTVSPSVLPVPRGLRRSWNISSRGGVGGLDLFESSNKLDFGARLSTSRCGGGAGFMWVPPAQSRLRRVAAWSRLDDEFREREEVSSLEGEDPGKEVQIDLQLPRRRLQVEFTCNVCQTRSLRLINPEAYKRGTVYVQCGGCGTYHQLVDNLGLVVEYDFRKEADSSPDPLDH